MYQTIKQDNNVSYNVNQYVCESIADLDTLPRCLPGSIAIVLEPGNIGVYIKDPKGKWVKV